MWTIPDSTHDLLTYLREQLQLFKMTKMWKMPNYETVKQQQPQSSLSPNLLL